jgi:hypothetical protein
MTPGPGKTLKEATATKRRHLYTHKRNLEDNESTRCGSREGAASLIDNDVTCPRCRGRED